MGAEKRREAQLSIPSENGQAGYSKQTLKTRYRKVVLKPGHSALDWNLLSEEEGSKGKFIHGLKKNAPWFEHFISLQHPSSLVQLQNGVSPTRIHPPLCIDKHILDSNKDNNWTLLRGRIYCLTNYLDFHPGGVKILLANCRGKDVTKLFDHYHRWISPERLLKHCMVGVYIAQ